MLTWPWTNIYKELAKRLEESKDPSKLLTWEQVKEDLKIPRKVSMFTKLKFKLYDLTWYLYRLYKPCHTNIRNSIPRKWVDLDEVLRTVNFEIIKSYYVNEHNTEGFGHTELGREFNVWIESAYKYITVERQAMEEDMFSETFKPAQLELFSDASKEYYEHMTRVENQIDDKDTEVLLNLIKFRKFLWS